MTTRSLIAACVLLLALTACSEDATPSPQVAPPDSPVSSGPLPDPKFAPSPAPSQVEQRDGLLDERRVAWSDPKVGTDDRSVTVSWWSGPEECYGLSRTEVVHGSKSIRIDVFEGRVPGAEVCPEIAMWKSTTIPLDEPVAGRSIEHLTPLT